MAERAGRREHPPARERSFRGTPVCGAIAVGPLHLLEPTADASGRPTGSPQDELAAFRDALAKARGQLEELLESQDALGGEILEFQAALAEDEDLIAPIEAQITTGTPAHLALADAMDGEIEAFRSGGDPVLSARADDLLDLKRRVLSALSDDVADAAPQIRLGSIVLAEALTPSQFLDLNAATIGGIATLTGSPTSHVAILARARGVPLIVGVEMELDAARSGQTAVLDCAEGRLTLEPAAAHLAEAQDRLALAEAAAKAAQTRAREPARTADGTAITVLINIDDPSALEDVDAAICDGVGLTRTEFLFRGGAPSEEEQRAFYDRLLHWAGGRPVTVRTLDAGGDKPIPGITIDGETNPFLGVRGVRLSLARPDVLRVQLRALLRVAPRAAPGQLKVMLPMVSVPEEVSAVRALAEEELERLRAAGVEAAMPALGMMVEVPCAALAAERFDVAFYSIGTNDLIQYLTASARDNADVAGLADPQNPAVRLVIEQVVAAGARRGVEVSVCGDMASSPRDVASLIAAGVRVLSVAPAQVGAVKAALSAVSAATADG